ncbi:MAG: LIC12162 family transferase [Ilumatobacteraceae bacterium]
MSRYLITTADESTWKFDRPVLFLGKWCLKEDRRVVWSSLDFSVVDLRSIEQELPGFYQQTQQLHAHLSADLTSALNAFHGLSFSHRFWNVIIGPWLRSFCDNIILRWAYLNRAITNFEIDETYAISDESNQYNHPRNFSEYRDSLKSQSWNQYMYSTMWSMMTSSQLSSPLVSQAIESNSLPRDLTTGGNLVLKKRIILSNTYLPRSSEAILAILLGSRPTRVPHIAAPTATCDPSARSRLIFDGAPVNHLHAIGREIVRDQIPSAYVEGLLALHELTRQLKLPDAPKLIFTSNRHLYDDVFNAWVAQATEHGSRYVIGQHGGHYGLSRFPSLSELHEKDVSDTYLTWGWGNSTKQLPGPCLTTVGRKYRPSAKAKHLLIVCDHLWAHPRSLFHDIPEHAGYLEYVTRCVTRLPTEIGKDVLIRLNHAHAETGSSQIEWWRTHGPTIEVDDGLSDMKNLLRQSRLIVSTSNGTTFLETLNLNIPTLITWNNDFVQLRDEALPYFKQLKEAGIFHDNDQSFVDHVTKHWGDIESWWASDVVQSARLMFCHQFSRIQPHPLLFLRRMLNTVNHTK